jgi:phage terminase large subunit-like protein
MSYEQDTDKFAGVPRHFTHYDEEPPHHIYDECQARLIDYNGDAWFTMTPVEGMTWVYEELFLPGEKGERGIKVVVADMTDNPYINQAGVANFLDGLDADARSQREHGQFVALGGLVYKQFKPETHVIPYKMPPTDWEWYASMDHGWNNPTCWLWHAVSPEGNVITFWEEYGREKLVKEWADIFHKKNEAFKRVPDIVVGDPAIKQTNAATGTSIQTEYSEHGVYIMPGINDVSIGVNQVQDYLSINSDTGKPYWAITENCSNLIREMQRLRWRTWAGRKAQYENNPQEQIHKKDDHAPDSARYFFTCLPDLKPRLRNNDGQEKVVLEPPSLLRYDEALAQANNTRSSGSTTWAVHESTDLSISSLEYD